MVSFNDYSIVGFCYYSSVICDFDHDEIDSEPKLGKQAELLDDVIVTQDCTCDAHFTFLKSERCVFYQLHF